MAYHKVMSDDLVLITCQCPIVCTSCYYILSFKLSKNILNAGGIIFDENLKSIKMNL